MARVRQDFANRSNVGAIVVNRQATGTLAGDRDYNRTFAVDGRFGIGQGGSSLVLRPRRRRPGAHIAARTPTAYRPAMTRNVLGWGWATPKWGRTLTRRLVSISGAASVACTPGFHVFPARELYGTARVTSSCNAQHYLELRDRAARNAVHPHRQPLGMGERTRGAHRGKPYQRRCVRGLRDFPDVVVPPGTYGHVEAQLTAETNQGAR